MCVYDPLGLEVIPPMVTVKSGSNLSAVCRVINPFGDYRMAWMTATGNEVTDNPLVQVTRLNGDLHLFVETVTEAVDYICVLRTPLEISEVLTIEDVNVDVTDVPGPPRNLEVASNGADYILITWTAPVTDNGSPLTAYYVNVTVEGKNSMVIQVSPHTTTLEYSARCKMIHVTVTSENLCGNSSADVSTIDTRGQCGKLCYSNM